MEEDPLQEQLFARAVAGQPLAPHSVHAPPILETQRNKTYDAARAGGRPPDGHDGPDPYWMLEEVVRRNRLVRCPDCGQDLIGAHNFEVERTGFGFLVCWALQRPYRLPAEVQPCHEGCVVACGRSKQEAEGWVKGRVTMTPIFGAGHSKTMVGASHVHADDDHVPMREVEDRGHRRRMPDVADPSLYRYTVYECPRAGCGVRVTTTMLHQARVPPLEGVVIEHEDGRIDMIGDVPDDWRTKEQQVIVT